MQTVGKMDRSAVKSKLYLLDLLLKKKYLKIFDTDGYLTFFGLPC